MRWGTCKRHRSVKEASPEFRILNPGPVLQYSTRADVTRQITYYYLGQAFKWQTDLGTVLLWYFVPKVHISLLLPVLCFNWKLFGQGTLSFKPSVSHTELCKMLTIILRRNSFCFQKHENTLSSKYMVKTMPYTASNHKKTSIFFRAIYWYTWHKTKKYIFLNVNPRVNLGYLKNLNPKWNNIICILILR